MSDDPTPYEKYVAPPSSIKFADMSSSEKSMFSLKLVCCICTMGFAFPNVMHD